MAARTFSSWVPVDVANFSEGRIVIPSIAARIGTPYPVSTLQTDVPRWTNADVGGGSALTEDTNNGDAVSMWVYQYNGKATFDQAMAEDAAADAIEAWTAEWYKSVNISYDNASFGVSGARSATVSDFRPYNSVYKVVRTTDNTGSVNYTADTNWAATGSGGLTYANLNAAKGRVEATQFWTDETGVCVMHPALKDDLRGILDTNGRPIFVESSAGMAAGATRMPDTLFNIPVEYSFGAQRSSSFKMPESGNKLIEFINRQYLRLGNRIPAQTRFIDAAINRDALEHTVQGRARLGTCLTVPFAASVLEVGAAT